nr:uncharacterized protein LOC128672655 [Plodia interpunctella]
MGVTFLQANLNHSARAQDLLLQSMAEWDLDVAVVAEPYAVPSLPHWAGDLDGLVAIVARPGAAPPLAIKKRGNGFVVALGLILDGRWSFVPHFRELGQRIIRTAASLGRLLPNLGGPSDAVRKLYSGVCRSMAMYGAPVWVDALAAENKRLLRQAQKVIAVRAIRGYRTVAFSAATALAGDPPWELVAEVLAEERGQSFEGKISDPKGEEINWGG